MESKSNIFLMCEQDLGSSWGSWKFSTDGQTMLNISYDEKNDMYIPCNKESINVDVLPLNEKANIENPGGKYCTLEDNEKNDKSMDCAHATEITGRILKHLKNGDRQKVKETFDELKTTDLEIVLNCVMNEIKDNISLKSNLLLALITSVNIIVSVVMQQIILPWSEVCCDNASYFIDNLVEFVGKFPMIATEEIIFPLLKSSQSILVEDQKLLLDVMSFLPSSNWVILLMKYIDYLEYSIQPWQLPILLTLTDESMETLNETRVLEQLVKTCANCVTEYMSNINFGNILISIARYDILTDNMKESMRTIADNMTGIIKIKVLKSLK